MADYKYKKTMIVTTAGIDIAWANMPEKDAARNLQIIKGAYAQLKEFYKSKAALKSDARSARLVVATKDPDNEDEVFFLESIGCGLMSATKWGGPALLFLYAVGDMFTFAGLA